MPFETPSKAPQTPAQAVEKFFEMFNKSKEGFQEGTQGFEKFVHEQIGRFVTREELEELQRRIEKGIEVPEIFKSSEARALLFKETQNRLVALQESLGSHGRGFREKIAEGWKGSGLNWNNWNPETKRTIRAVGVGVAVATGAYLVYRFGKWLFGGTKKAVEKTREGMGWLKKMLLIGGGIAIAGAAGYFGLKRLEKFMGEKLVGPIKDQLAKAEEGLTKLKKKRDEVMDKVAGASAEQKANFEQILKKTDEKINSQNELIEKLNNRLSKNDDADDTPSDEEAGEGGKGKGTPEVTPEVVDTAKDIAYSRMARALLAFHPKLGQGVQVTHLQGLLYQNEEKSMGCILDAGRYEELEIPKEDREEREKAVQFLAEYARRYGKMQGVLEDEIIKQDIRDFCSNAAVGFISAGQIQENVVASGGNVEEFARRLDLEQIVISDPGIREAIQEILEELASKNDLPEGWEELDKGRLLKEAFLLGDVDIRSFLTPPPSEREDLGSMEPEKRMVLLILESIAKEIESGDTHKFVLPFFHGELIGERKKGHTDEQHVRELLLSCMPLHQSMRYYLYQRSMLKGNPAGALLMQAQVLKYLYEEETGVWGKLKWSFHGAWEEALEKFAVGAYEEFTQEFSVTEEQREKVTSALSAAGGVMSSLGKRGFKAALKSLLVTITAPVVPTVRAGLKHPKTTAGILTASGMLYRFTGKNPHDTRLLLDRYKGKTEVTKFEWVRRMFGRPSQGHVQHAFKNYAEKIYDKIDGISNPNKKKILRYALNDTIRTPLSNGAWKRFAKLADAQGFPHIAKRARLFTGLGRHARAMRKAVETMQHKKLNCFGIRWAAVPSDRLAQLTQNTYRALKRLGFRGLAISSSNLAKLTQNTYRALKRLGFRGLAISSSNLAKLAQNPFHQWRLAAGWQRAAWVGGVGLQGLALYGDIQEVGALEEEKEEAIDEYGKSYLARLRESLEGNPSFEAVPDKEGEYRYRGLSGKEDTDLVISLRVAETQMSKAGEAFDERISAQKLRTQTSAVAFGTTMLMGARAFSGPLGIAVVTVELGVRGVINAIEQGKMREFLTDPNTPPWLLAAMGVQRLTGVSEYDWLTDSSSWMVSDIYKGQSDHTEIRQRMLFTIFNHDLSHYAPGVLEEITGGLMVPEFIDLFYREDFRKIVLPAFKMFLFQEVDAGWASWATLSQADIDHGLVVLPPRATIVDIRAAMRKAAILYLQHIREKRYLEHCNLREKLGQEGFEEPELNDLVEQMGDVEVFGGKLSSVSHEEYERNKSRTRAEIIVDKLTANLNTAGGDMREEKLKSNPKLFTISSGFCAGLAGDLDFDTSKSTYDWISDPVFRLKMEQVSVETLGEEMAEKKARWNDWIPNTERMFDRISDADKRSDDYLIRSIQNSEMFAAANNIAAELSEPSLTPEATVFGVMTGTRSGKGISKDKAAEYVTTAGTRLVESEPDKSKGLSRNKWLEEELYSDLECKPVVYGHPFAYGIGKYPNGTKDYYELCSKLSDPGVQVDGLKLKDLQAVFFERRLLEGTTQMVLATYIFGDLESNKVSVLQRAAAMNMVSRQMNFNYTPGAIVPYTASEFLKKPKAEEMLDLAKEDCKERITEMKKIEEEAKRKEEEAEEKQREWKEEIVPSDFQFALGAAQKNPHAYHRIGNSDQYLTVADGKYVVYKPNFTVEGPVLSSPEGLSEVRSSVLAEYKSKEDALKFYQTGERDTKALFVDFGYNSLGKRREDRLYPIVQALACKPITRDSRDVVRIVDLFRRWKKGGHRLVEELKEDLCSMYEMVNSDRNRAFFLREVFSRIKAKSGISPECCEEVAEWFKSNGRMFGIGKRRAA